MNELYHYTCQHGLVAIGARGELLPASALTTRPVPPWGNIIWLTDLTVPNREVLGLTQERTTCDRTKFCYRVTDQTNIVHWPKYARTVPWRHLLEYAPEVLPMHWYVSTEPVPVVLAHLR